MRNTKPLWKRTRIGLMSLCLMTLLPACAKFVMPEQSLLADCAITAVPDGQLTNRQLGKLALDRETDTMVCNADKAALREWYEEACKKSKKACRKD